MTSDECDKVTDAYREAFIPDNGKGKLNTWPLVFFYCDSKVGSKW